MKKGIYTFLFLLFTWTIGLCQNDASLTYIDLIAQNNLQVQESRNQHIINWDEVPFKMEGVSSMKESFFVTRIDSTHSADTIIVIDSIKEAATKTYSQLYEYKNFEDGIRKIIIDTTFIVTYKNDTLISQEDFGTKMQFNYYPSGLLKELVLESGKLIESQQSNDTTTYNLVLIDPMTKKPIFSENMPQIGIKCFPSKNEGCYHYKNIYTFKKLSDTSIVNKELIQCQNGNVIKEIILDRYKNYAQKAKDYDFEYDGTKLIKKICKPDVQYSDYYHISYIYDDRDNLKKIIGHTVTSEFEYDERNNVISRLDYFTQSRLLQKLWIREIEYEE